MRARETGKSNKPISTRRFRYLLYGAGVLVILISGSISLAGLILVQKMKQFEGLMNGAELRYMELNERFAFSPPGPPSDAEAQNELRELARKYQATRARLMDEIGPEREAYARTLLVIDGRENREAFLLFKNEFREFVGQMIDAHVEALEREELSAEGFLWFHGLAMRDKFTEPRTNEFYARLLGNIRRSSGDEEGTTNVSHYNELLEKRYSPWSASGVEAEVPESSLEGLIDLLLLNYELHQETAETEALTPLI